jgi:hypothetical protein|tara:strand:- start:1302 stop:2000 length:699 start_codon:yes stop_codon:yes gene_type:complete
MKKVLNEWRKFINESGFNRIKNILQGNVASVSAIGFMTGENPMAQKMSSKENRTLNKELMAWMRERGYGPIRIQGRFGNKERSMMIPNITREDMAEAGKYFNQESVIWGEKTGEDKFVFEYIEGDKTMQKRDAVLFDDEVQAREDFFSQERQSAGRKFFIPFFDEQYEMEEGFESDYDLPGLTETQKEEHKDLIKDINERVAQTLDISRTPKSRWHHRQILRINLRELRKKL